MKTVCFALFFFANFLHAQTRIRHPHDRTVDIVSANGIYKDVEDLGEVDLGSLAGHIEIHFNSQSQNAVVLDADKLDISNSTLTETSNFFLWFHEMTLGDPGAQAMTHTVSFTGKNHSQDISGNCKMSVMPGEIWFFDIHDCKVDDPSKNRFNESGEKVKLPCEKSQFFVDDLLIPGYRYNRAVNQDSRQAVPLQQDAATPIPSTGSTQEGGGQDTLGR